MAKTWTFIGFSIGFQHHFESNPRQTRGLKWAKGDRVEYLLGQFEIIGFDGDRVVIERLQELGFLLGERISILAFLPFGGPVFIRHKNAFMSLRRRELGCLKIQRERL